MGLAALAVALTLAGSAHHAVLPNYGLPFDLWQDASGVHALRRRGEFRVTIVSGRDIFTVDDGELTRRDRYPTRWIAWRVATAQYETTPAQAAYALAHGNRVARPAFMTPPKPGTVSVTYTDDFGTNLRAFRRATRWPVPSSPRPVLGFRLTDAVIVTEEGTTRATELFHDRLGRVLSFQTGPANGAFYRASHDALDSTARFADGMLIVSRGSAYVTVVVQSWTPTRAQWRTIAARART